ncbi:MAG TPA: FAD-dependent tricarballylate dehydrogenase TcuA [Vicinamibacterales bacterium]|nr:FAD-dependent tricarballylate dehydrogenase TcuA [Vicinamibacterales bacterium]
MSETSVYDVAVVGGGNAALCAAIAARRAGARVVVLERAPRHFRGGNSRHTRNFRCLHTTPGQYLTGTYTEDEFLSDLRSVNGGPIDESLARMAIQQSATCPEWMAREGVRFQAALHGTLQLGRTNLFFLGGGKALMNTYYASAERLGIDTFYDADVVDLRIAKGRFESVDVQIGGRRRTIRAASAVIASGGFEANLEWLREAWGEIADNFIIRGTPYNTGVPLKRMLEAGAQQIGDPRECHAIAVDARAPKFDGGIVTRLDCIPFGIVVNSEGHRFYDEGEEVWPKRYAIWGKLIARQPAQIAYSIVDAKTADSFMPSVFPPIVANSIGELARLLTLEPATLAATVETFNGAVRPGTLNPSALDDCRTEGLSPNKTHWAQRLDTPPYWAYPLRPGITFTYLGLKVDAHTRVLMSDGQPAANVYAAGEVMAGNLLLKGYLAGFGMTIGTVFGRIAGEEAARHAVR